MDELIQLRKKIFELERDERLFKETEKTGKIGGWQFDPATLKQTWTKEVFRILEIDLEQGAPEVPQGLEFIDPEFRPMAEKAIQRAMELGEPYNQEWIVTTASGNKKWVNAVCSPKMENGKLVTVSGSFQDITSRKKAEEHSKKIEWLLQSKKEKPEIRIPDYGDLTTINHNRTILDSVGKEVLNEIVSDYLSLLETSAAVYEKNGDYAVGIFSSEWCQFMDCSSRALCKTKDNKKALKSGKWLCHESCWADASNQSIQTNKPVDVECSGGIRIYAIPIRANNEVIGSINFGYGNPPTDKVKLNEIAANYNVSANKLKGLAQRYETRPAFIIDIAKEKLETSAKLIGNIVERKQAEEQLKALNQQLVANEQQLRAANQQLSASEQQLLASNQELLANEQQLRAANQQLIASEQQLKEANKNIKEREKLLRLIDNTTFDQIYSYDLDNRFTSANKTLCGNLKLSADDIIGKSYWELGFPEENCKAWDELHRKTYSKGYTTEIVSTPMPDGTTQYFEVNLFVLKDSDGSTLGIAGVNRNITERIQAENELKEKSEFIDKIIDSSALSTWISDDKGTAIRANSACLEFFGATEEEVIGKYNIFKDSVLEKLGFIPDIQKVFEKGEVSNLIIDYNFGEVDHISVKNAAHKIANSIFTPILDINGKVSNVIIQTIDLSEIKKAEKITIEERNKTQQYLDIADVMLLSIDTKGTVQLINPKGCEILGYSKEEILGQNWFDLALPEDQREMVKEVARKVFSKEIESVNYYENNIVTKSGVERLIAFHNSVLTDENGNIIGTLSSGEDITERKQAEEELIEAKQKAEESEKQLKLIADNFVNGMIYQVAMLDEERRRFNYISKNVNELYGCTVEEAKENADLIYGKLHPDDINGLIEKEKEALKNMSVFETESRVLTPDGNIRWAYYMSQPRIINGIVCWDGIEVDITERKLMELALIEAKQKAEESQANITAIIEGTNNSIWSFDRNYQIRYINHEMQQEFLQSFGLLLEPEMSLIEALPKSLQSFWKPRYDRVLANEQFTIEDTVPTDNGTLYVQVSFNPIVKNGQVIGGSCFGSNITSRKLAEIELIKAKEKAEESELQFKQLFESEADAVFIADVGNGIILDVNRAGEKLMQMQKNEIIGLHQSNLHPENIDEFSTKSFTGHKQTTEKREDAVLIENKIVRKNGEEVPVEILASKVRFKGKECLISTFRDITERKKAEEALRKSEEMIISSQSVANICSYSTTLNENELEKSTWICSPEFYNIFGIDETYPHTIAGWVGFIHPDYRDKLAAYHEYVVKNKTSFHHQYKIIRINDGVERWVEGTGELEFDTQGNPIRMYGAIQDITERKKAENELLEKEVQYHNLANSGTALIWASGLDKLCFYFNDPWLNFTGRTLEQEYGNGWAEGVHPDDFDHCLNIYVTSFDKKVPFEMEYRMKRADGEYRWILDLGTPNYNSVGEFVGYIGHCFDITDRKKVQKDLIEAKLKAEESDRLKSAFLANMSHEIRTPMNGILGFTSLLQEANLTGEEQQKYIEIIQKSGDRMLNTVNDIIDISKIESGLIQLSVSEVNINEKLKDLHSFFKHEAAKKGIQLVFKNDVPEHDSSIVTDFEKFNSIVTNLIKNAIKFTNQGFIELGCTIKKEDGSAKLEFYVKDSGIGIPKDRQKAIFDRFIQADIEDKRASQGSGLGLAISKAYVEMLDGKIWVDSKPGRGSVFYFTLPYNPDSKENEIVKAEESDVCEKENVRKRNILIAEDDETSEELLSIMLASISKKIFKSKTGKETIEICRNNPDIDLVLMDIQMPEINGLEATRQIRKFNKDVIIIAQTAYALIGDEDKAMQSGCNAYISKPIQKGKLLDLVSKLFV